MSERLEAHGGRAGGAGTPSGEQVVVCFDGAILDVFTETSSLLYHAATITSIELASSPAPTGEALVVTARRHGCQVPVRFEGEQRAALERIVAAVRAAGPAGRA